MLAITFNGEFDPNDSNIIHYTGESDYGQLTVTLNRQTGAWSATVPPGFPPGIDITATWQDLSPTILRPEAELDQIAASLSQPEAIITGQTIGTITGTVDFTLPCDSPFFRAAIAPDSRLQEDLNLTSSTTATPIPQTITVLDQSKAPWILKTSRMLPVPFQVKAIQSTSYCKPGYAVAETGITHVGLAYGVPVANPSQFLGHHFIDGLQAWWPMNEHPASDLAITERCSGATTRLTGFMANDRMLVDGYGFGLHIPKGRNVVLPLLGAADERLRSICLCLQPQTRTKSGITSPLLKIGNLEVCLSSVSGTQLRIIVGDVTLLAQNITLGDDYFLALVHDGVNNLLKAVTLWKSTDAGDAPTRDAGPFLTTVTLAGAETITLACEAITCIVRDIRMWNVEKTQAEFLLNRQPVIATVPYAYWPSVVDGFPLFTWPKSGFVYANSTPLDTLAEYELEQEAATSRMDEAIVSGDERLEVLGIDGGQMPSLPWKLGQQFHPVLLDGKVAYSTTVGVIGSNAAWESEFNYAKQANRNVAAHRLFTTSVDGRSWQITVGSTLGVSGAEPVLNIDEVDRAGTCTRLIDNGQYELTVVGGTLSRSAVPTTMFPTGFVYCPSQAAAEAGFEDWINTSDFGTANNVAALESRGKLSFLIGQALQAGPHQLLLDAGNIGQVGKNFTGFNVEVNINNKLSFAVVTAKGTTKVNPRGVVAVDFELDEPIGAGWLLEVNWNGIIDNPQRNISYALAVYGIKINYSKPLLYQITGPDELTLVNTAVATTPGTLPGGWIGTLGTNGEIASWQHESDLNTRVIADDFVGRPLSEVLTGITSRRLEDIRLASSDWVVSDDTAVAPPTIGTFSTNHTANEGDTLTYTTTGVTSALALVWEFWDGELRVTEPTVTSQSKVLAKGGSITAKLTAINSLGVKTVKTDTFTANSAPVVTDLALSINDQAAPFTTIVTTVASDPDSPSSVIFGTLDGTVYTSNAGTILSTIEVTDDTLADLVLSDLMGAKRTIPLSLRTRDVQPITIATTVSPTFARIGTGSVVTLSAIAIDADGSAIDSFSWSLTTANGWSSDQTLTGATSVLNGGGSKNTVSIDISGEEAGKAVAVLTVTTSSGKTATAKVIVTLVSNSAPVLRHFGITPARVIAGNQYAVSADAYDPDNDAINYVWTFGTLTRRGNPVVITATGPLIDGQLEMTDSLGATTVATIPQVLMTSNSVVSAVVGQQLTYVPIAMGNPTPTFDVTSLPDGFVYVDGTISGIPTVVGTGTIGLTASNVSGQDVRTIYIVTTSGGEITAPTNLLVKGMVYPTYRTGDDISITWSNNSNYESVIKLYDLNNDLKLTVNIGKGITEHTITNSVLLKAISTDQPFVIRAYSRSNGVVSQGFVESGVDFVS